MTDEDLEISLRMTAMQRLAYYSSDYVDAEVSNRMARLGSLSGSRHIPALQLAVALSQPSYALPAAFEEG